MRKLNSGLPWQRSLSIHHQTAHTHTPHLQPSQPSQQAQSTLPFTFSSRVALTHFLGPLCPWLLSYFSVSSRSLCLTRLPTHLGNPSPPGVPPSQLYSGYRHQGTDPCQILSLPTILTSEYIDARIGSARADADAGIRFALPPTGPTVFGDSGGWSMPRIQAGCGLHQDVDSRGESIHRHHSWPASSTHRHAFPAFPLRTFDQISSANRERANREAKA